MSKINSALGGKCKVCRVEPEVFKLDPTLKKASWDILINYAVPGSVGEAEIPASWKWKKGRN